MIIQVMNRIPCNIGLILGARGDLVCLVVPQALLEMVLQVRCRLQRLLSDGVPPRETLKTQRCLE